MEVSSDIKKRIIQTVNVFETGKKEGDYGCISIYADGVGNTRQVTYGRSQTTEQGLLGELLTKYVENRGVYGVSFVPYLTKIGKKPLWNDDAFLKLLKQAGEDPAMRHTQDSFFDEKYYLPALKWATDNGFIHPLSLLVIYDSFIHSGRILQFLRDQFEEFPPARGGNEKKWIAEYIRIRRGWLAYHRNKILRKTTYRMDTILDGIKKDNWSLSLPIAANGQII